MFLLSSFWHYKHDHLRHHAFLGTPDNREFFNYRFRTCTITGAIRSNR
ncbi:hypothetical protein Saa2_08778 [Streptomyces acidiscabies]|nr:hypothetical protein Saa2_08778 [Streptomyces acidiscabies]